MITTFAPEKDDAINTTHYTRTAEHDVLVGLRVGELIFDHGVLKFPDIATPPPPSVCLSVCPSICLSVRVKFFICFRKTLLYHFISRFMLFST